MTRERAKQKVDCAIFVALREEMRPLTPLLKKRQACRASDGRRFTCGTVGPHTVSLCRTGIGSELAEARALSLIETVTPRRVLALGFAGGLQPHLRPGHLVLAEKVSNAAGFDSDVPRAPHGWGPPRYVRERPIAIPTMTVVWGHLISVDRVLRGQKEKRAAGAALAADAVDMESAAIAAVAAANSIPTLCARAILDPCDLELPFDFGQIVTPDGQTRPFKALLTLGTRPSTWPSLAALRSAAGQAATALAQALPALLDLLEPES